MFGEGGTTISQRTVKESKTSNAFKTCAIFLKTTFMLWIVKTEVKPRFTNLRMWAGSPGSPIRVNWWADTGTCPSLCEKHWRWSATLCCHPLHFGERNSVTKCIFRRTFWFPGTFNHTHQGSLASSSLSVSPLYLSVAFIYLFFSGSLLVHRCHVLLNLSCVCPPHADLFHLLSSSFIIKVKCKCKETSCKMKPNTFSCSQTGQRPPCSRWRCIGRRRP